MLSDKLKLHIIEYMRCFEYYLNCVKHRVAFSIDWIFHIGWRSIHWHARYRSLSRDVIPYWNTSREKRTHHPITKQQQQQQQQREKTIDKIQDVCYCNCFVCSWTEPEFSIQNDNPLSHQLKKAFLIFSRMFKSCSITEVNTFGSFFINRGKRSKQSHASQINLN